MKLNASYMLGFIKTSF